MAGYSHVNVCRCQLHLRKSVKQLSKILWSLIIISKCLIRLCSLPRLMQSCVTKLVASCSIYLRSIHHEFPQRVANLQRWVNACTHLLRSVLMSDQAAVHWCRRRSDPRCAVPTAPYLVRGLTPAIL